jgi:hypothetical protein
VRLQPAVDDVAPRQRQRPFADDFGLCHELVVGDAQAALDAAGRTGIAVGRGEHRHAAQQHQQRRVE